MKEARDEEVVRLCLLGNKEVFGILVQRYEKAMFNTALQIVGDYSEATEVTQASFVSAYEHLGSFDPRYRFFSWLYRITVNGALNAVSSRKHRAAIDESMVAADGNAEESVSASDLAGVIQRALRRLTPEYRAVIVLSHFQDLPYREISRILNISENKVKSRLYSARQQLKKLLSSQGIPDAS